MFSITIPGTPVTKKNSMQILVNKRTGRPFVSPSKKYKEYKAHCDQYLQVEGPALNEPMNIACVYYMPTRRRVDLINLISATMDILVDCGVLEDDNCKIVCSHDGSKVCYDKENPRVEITFTRTDDCLES